MLKFASLALVAGSVLTVNSNEVFAERWGRPGCYRSYYSAPARYGPAYYGNSVNYNYGYVPNATPPVGAPQVASGQGYRSFSVDPGSQPARPLPLSTPQPTYAPADGIYTDGNPPRRLSDLHNGMYLGADRKVRGLDSHH